MKGLNFRKAFQISVISIPLSACGPSVSPRPSETVVRNPSAHSVEPYETRVATEVQKATVGRRGNWSLTSEKVTAVADLVASNAQKHNVPEDLLFGIIWVESRFDPRAVSPVGARGLMQLMPGTAKYLADCLRWDGRKNSFDPEFNITAGSYYIARLIREFKGDENLALAAYNAGPSKVRRWLAAGGLPEVSLAYASMVQTARSFFAGSSRTVPLPGTTPLTPTPSIFAVETAPDQPLISNETLDRLGLAILIAGFKADAVTGLRTDEENPFEQ